MNENLIDPSCINNSGLNSNLFPVGTAQHLDPNFNMLPFLCDLLKLANDPNATGILTPPIEPYDITPFTDYSPLTAVGDPRVSLGETMTQTFIHFLPRMITQTEVRQAGGTQVIDNYICTADGVPIKQSETVNAVLSLDLTGQKAYQYGAITVPPISATFEELMKPIHPDEVINFVESYVNGGRNASASDFVSFINTYFPNNIKEVDLYETPPTLIVTVNDVVFGNKRGKLYIRYYDDVALKVGCLLGLSTINQYTTSNLTDFKLSFALASSIPDYKLFLTDKKAADVHYNYLMNNFFDDGSITLDDNSSFEDLEKQFKNISNSFSSIQNTQSSNPIKVSCTSI
jgi:hypothetical protein